MCVVALLWGDAQVASSIEMCTWGVTKSDLGKTNAVNVPPANITAVE